MKSDVVPYHVFGIRHHGPGSAKSLKQALEGLQPDCILVEGPPEADAILSLVPHQQMQPPVAILAYVPDEPQRAVYYPFVEYSPEWQAIQYGLSHALPVHFMDLPVGMGLAREKALEAALEAAEAESCEGESTQAAVDEKVGLIPQSDDEGAKVVDAEAPSDSAGVELFVRQDPLSLLAEAAGYNDSERWWEHMVEERQDSTELFEAIAEAMSALRTELDESSPRDALADQREQLREAHMRKVLRKAIKAGHERIAVVCGAWHVPALQTLPTLKSDNDLLKGLPKLKIATTWVPWTHSRLSSDSGYGAGIQSPGWYAHLWRYAASHHEHDADRSNPSSLLTTRWLIQVAQTFRDQGQDVSSAHVIEAVRLAEALAAMRGRSLPGLLELNEAVQSIMLFGDALPMQLLHHKLIIGEVLGAVPDETPQTPLQQDLTKQQRRLRLKPSAADKDLTLDLRKPNDLEKSYLFRRLGILGIDWGQGGYRGAGKGTFKENWKVQWQPEFAVQLIEAGLWGNTLEEAAANALVQRATQTHALAELATMAHQSLYANLPMAVDLLMQRLQDEAAINSDTVQLMEALPELARLLRYGDVRNTSVQQVAQVVSHLVTRISIGLPNACHSLNEEAAEAMFRQIQSVQEAITTLDEEVFTTQWTQALVKLSAYPDLQGVLAGRCCRLLLQMGVIDEKDTAQRLSLALSTANEPAQAASWVDGFLRGSGQLLIYDEALWTLVDQWVSQLKAESFQQLLPILRRTFASFEAAERRQMGERVTQGKSMLEDRTESALDEARAALALPLLSTILGLEVSDAV